jgi:type VI secretion system protein VasG
MFFQIFDKGWMEDAEGRYIDFKNTLILLTSNVGTDLVMGLCKDPELMPEADGIAKALREPLLKVFPPALLGRLVVIPYYPLSDEVLASIIRLQLKRIGKRITENHRIRFTYDDEVIKLIASRCSEVESGARRGRDPDQYGPAAHQPGAPDAHDGREEGGASAGDGRAGTSATRVE